jgi:hypothetical protein
MLFTKIYPYQGVRGDLTPSQIVSSGTTNGITLLQIWIGDPFSGTAFPHF